MDHKKRTTLKTMALTAGAVATGGTASALGLYATDQNGHTTPVAELAQIDVHVWHSASINDIAIVFTNAGSETTTITQLTPNKLVAARGEFDFSELLKDGPLRLEPGQSVSAPIKREVSNNHAAVPPITESLRSKLSIITDNDAYASVSVPGLLNYGLA